MSRGWETHIKREREDGRTEAFDPAICGRRDPGTLAYQTLAEGDALTDEISSYCEGCRAAQQASFKAETRERVSALQ